MKASLHILFLCTLPALVTAQDCTGVTFTYDEAGNRIRRKLVVESCTLAEIPDSGLTASALIPADETPPPDRKETGDASAPNSPAGEEYTAENAGAAPPRASVYPNPAQDRVYVELHDAPESSDTAVRTMIYLYDGAGKQIFSAETHLPRTEVDVAGLPPGAYYLKVVHGDYRAAHKICKY